MKRFILTVVLAVATFTCSFAQSETFRNAARSLIEGTGSSLSPENMKKAMTGTIEGTIKAMIPDAETSPEVKKLLERLNKEVFEPYFGTDEFINDIVDVISIALEKEFTEAEVKELVRIYSTPEAKAITKKSDNMMLDMGGMMQEMMPAITSIVQGGEAPQIKKVDCTDEYRKVFMEFYDLFAAASIQKLESQFAGDDSPQAQKLMGYMKEAMPELTLKMVKDTYTIEDLKFCIKLTGNPLSQRYLKISSNLDENTMQPIMEKLGAKLEKVLSTFQP